MNLVDRVICELDTGLRTVFAPAYAERPMPKPRLLEGEKASGPDDIYRAESIRLMRINHCGEVCAQALYQGQAVVAKNTAAKEFLLRAANEEHDHLAWCSARLAELSGQASLLSPAFYAGAFGMGIASGLLGDKWSMGFLVETERQVEAHLDDHLERISPDDAASRAILNKMRDDEIRHGLAGQENGAIALPTPVRLAMRVFSKFMTKATYWV